MARRRWRPRHGVAGRRPGRSGRRSLARSQWRKGACRRAAPRPACRGQSIDRHRPGPHRPPVGERRARRVVEDGGRPDDPSRRFPDVVDRRDDHGDRCTASAELLRARCRRDRRARAHRCGCVGAGGARGGGRATDRPRPRARGRERRRAARPCLRPHPLAHRPDEPLAVGSRGEPRTRRGHAERGPGDRRAHCSGRPSRHRRGARPTARRRRRAVGIIVARRGSRSPPVERDRRGSGHGLDERARRGHRFVVGAAAPTGDGRQRCGSACRR